MASTGDILGTGVSALLAFQRALSTVGHNIANVNTDGFTRQRVDLGTRTPQAAGNGFIGKGVEINSVRRVYNQFLTEQVRGAATAFNELDSLYSFATQVDNLLADPEAGLLPTLQDFFNAVQDVADDPTSGVTRQVMLSEANSLTGRFQFLDQRLADLRGGVNTELRNLVTEINGLSTSIAQTNRDILIAQSAVQGQPPNDLLDRRDALVAQLAEIVGVTTVAEDNGTLSIFIGNGQTLLIGDRARTLGIVGDTFDPTRAEIAFAPPFSSSVISDFLTGGRLGGVLAFRSQTLDTAQNALGRLAIGLADTFNAQHRLGQDMNGALGGLFFQGPSPASFPSGNSTTTTNITVTFDDAAALTTADYRLQFDGTSAWSLTNLSTNQAVTLTGSGTDADPFIGDGLSISVQPLGAGGGDSYSFLIRPTRTGAADIGVALTDPALIAVAAPIRTSASLNNLGTGQISAGVVNAPPPPNANLQQTVTITFNNPPTTFDVSGTGTGNPTGVSYTDGANIGYNGWTFQITGSPAAGDTFTIQANTNGVGDNRNALLLADLQNRRTLAGDTISYEEAYTQVVADVGAKTRQTQINRDAQSSLLSMARDARDSVSGVNLDEEAANLLRFQQAYQAAAQVIATANLMFEELIGVMRR